MFKHILLIGALVLTSGTFAQKKELTLKDAVSNQYRSFGPDRLYGFQWIPNTDAYSFFSKNYQTVYKSSAITKEDRELLTIQAFNTACKSEMTSFFGLQWKNENEFYLNDGVHYYLYNTSTGVGKILHTIDGEVGATLFSNSTENVAYTIENNVFIHTMDGLKLVVTSNSDKNKEL